MSTLYELTADFKWLYDLASDPETDEQTFLDTLACLEGELEVKAESYVFVIKDLEAAEKVFTAQKQAFLDAAAEWDAKAKACANNAKKVKERMKEAMIATGHDDKTGLQAGDFTLKVVGNGGKQPMVVDKESVPENFMRIIYEPDNELIRTALERGEELPFAHLEPRGTRLAIK